MEQTMFKDEEELFEALGEVEPCDLRDEKTTTEDAVKFCKGVMTCLARAENLVPNKDRLAAALYRLGACEYKKAPAKFLVIENATVGMTLEAKNNIQFPLSAFSQLLSAKQSTFIVGWEKVVEGGKYSWANTWLESQQQKEAGVEK